MPSGMWRPRSLGCLGYGSVFLAARACCSATRLFPAAVILLWESINGFLPAALQKLSVLHYLQSLCPEAAPIDETSAILRLLLAPAAPASKSLAIAGLVPGDGPGALGRLPRGEEDRDQLQHGIGVPVLS